MPSTVEAILDSEFLKPQIVNGWAVGSFCILNITDIRFGSIPNPITLTSLNCSYRYGVVDAISEPCVYVEERCTSSKLGSWLTSLGFPGFHPHVVASISHREPGWSIRANGPLSFDAEVLPGTLGSKALFESEAHFSEFMAKGKRSYCPSIDSAKLNVVDLAKSESVFEPIHCLSWQSNRFAGEQLDSVYRTEGGLYEWTFSGQVDAKSSAAVIR